MKQEFTSAMTSINRDKLPRVFTSVEMNGLIVLDYGCGRYTDHIKRHVEAQNAMYLPYDPFNQPEAVNVNSRSYAMLARIAGVKTVAVLSNVLNVIKEDSIIVSIVNDALQLTGNALIAIYEGDRTGNGKQTGTDQWQRNERKAAYIQLLKAHGLHATSWHGFIRVTA